MEQLAGLGSFSGPFQAVGRSVIAQPASNRLLKVQMATAGSACAVRHRALLGVASKQVVVWDFVGVHVAEVVHGLWVCDRV